MTEPKQMWIRYLFAAGCIVALIAFYDREGDRAVESAVKSLEIEVENLDTEFCETINQMHRMRGFEVMDCEQGRVKLIPTEDHSAPEL